MKHLHDDHMSVLAKHLKKGIDKMQSVLAVLSLIFLTTLFAYDSSEKLQGLQLAEKCDPENCKLPNCRCSSFDIPGGLAPQDTPQFVTVIFEDVLNTKKSTTYLELLYNRNNSNGCRAGATFFISHENTNYESVNILYNQGFEIALHSISHQTSQDYWREATYDDLKKEFVDQIELISHFANIPANSIKGMRLPFLQLSGNTSFKLMADHGVLYDNSWSTVSYTNTTALWPYTLDYASTQACNIAPCPTASIPEPWVMPIVSWIDLEGRPCPMIDACTNVPDRKDDDAWFDFILDNFARHYTGNKAAFSFNLNERYLKVYPAVETAIRRFLDVIKQVPDIFMVNSEEVIEWVKNPISIPEYRKKACRSFTSTVCQPTYCSSIVASHNNEQYSMSLCNACPQIYPWLGNPLGLEPSAIFVKHCC